jgi:GT2 family glycosyltransferase
VDDAFTVGIPLSMRNASAHYTLKLFIRTVAFEKEQRLSLSVGKREIAEINLDSKQICYPVSIPAAVVEKSATHIIQNAGSAYDKKYNGFDKGSGEPDKGQYDEMQETEMFCGGACLLSKKALAQTGLFNSRYFSYYEDSDLSLRLKRKGFKIVYAPNAFVFHHHSGSGKEWSPFFTYHVFRNKIIFSAKNFGIHGFFSAFKERSKETWFLLKWAARGRFSDHNLRARLKLNYHILIDAVVGIIKYKPAKF